MKSLFLYALATMLVAVPLAAADDAFTGKWQLHQSIAGHESDSTCTFTQTGNELSGSCVSEAGTVQIAGKVEDKKATWSFKSEYNGSPLTVNYSGTLDSNKITGTVAVPEYSVEGEFTATQSK